MPSKQQKKKAYKKKYYQQHRENVCNADKPKKAEYNRIYYIHNADKIKRAAKAQYRAQLERKKRASRARYKAQPENKKATSRAWYRAWPERKKVTSHAYFSKNRSARLFSFRRYYSNHKEDICLEKKPRYVLLQPKPAEKEMYLRELQAHLFHDIEARSKLTKTFKKLHKSVAKRIPRVLGRTVCRLAARRLLNKAMQVRKELAGLLLKSSRSIKSLQITQREDFGIGCHTMASEPFFYDSAYQHVKRDIPIPINEDGQCVVAEELHTDGKGACAQRKKWECSCQCKPITDTEVDSILTLKAAFDKPIKEVRHALDGCDSGCPNGHYFKVIEFSSVALKGHPLVYSGGCKVN